MKKIILICISAGLGILFYSCQKDLSSLSDKENKPGTLNDFFDQNRNAGHKFTGSASSPIQVVTAKGTKILFENNSFVDESNSPVSGTINIAVKEILTPAEMILSDMPTVAGNRLLESGGEYNITVTQSNRKLKLAPGKYLKMQLPDIGVSSTNMQVFNGSLKSNGTVDWTLNSNPGNFVVRDSFFIKTELFADSVNWINCDRLINEPTVEFNVYPGNAPISDSTSVYVHLTGRNTVVKMFWTGGLSYFNSNTLLPVQSSIIGISKKNGQLYLSVVPVLVQNRQSVTLNFSPCTEEQLKAKLALLR